MIIKSLTNSVILALLISCAAINKTEKTKISCDENLKFKVEFFNQIKNVETQMITEKDESFDRSLEFISKYAHVSFESMANYAHTYPIGIFQQDKKGWLSWYEENKCKNIQFK